MGALLLAAGSFGAVAAAPVAVLRMIPAVKCITPERMVYEKRINATGAIEALEQREVYLETPVIASSVRVAVGDRVKKDQVLATIDTSLTKSVLAQSIPSSELSGLLSAGGQQAADLAGLYSALSASALGADLGPLDELVSAVSASTDEKAPANNYIYIPEVLTAPMDGVVTSVGLKSDVLSRTAKPLVTISDTGSYAAMVTVGESYSADLRVGDEAVLTGTGFAGKTYHGRVSRIYPVARKTGVSQEAVVDVEIAIDDPDDALKAGFSTRAEILTDTRRDMLTIPYESVRQDENNTEYVYVLQDSQAVRRDIKTGLELLEGVEVIEGLAPDELLVSDAADVKPGVRVRLQRG